MSEQISLFPVEDYGDRPDYTDIYYLPTSTRTKQFTKRKNKNDSDKTVLGSA